MQDAQAQAPSSPTLDLQPITGPSAFGGTPRRFLELLWLQSLTEFRARYANTTFGYLWTIVKPLAFFGVIFLVIRGIIRFGDDIEHYALILVTGIVLFQYFQETTQRGLRAVASKEAMVRKMQFPRIVIPLSVGLTASFTLLLNWVAVLPLFLISGVGPMWSWLLLPAILVALILLTTGASMILSVVYIRTEDIGQGWALVSRMMFYATPILYPIERITNETLREIIASNPLAPIVIQARVWLIDNSAPGPVDAAGPIFGLLIPGSIAVVTVVFGLWFFNREAPRVAEEL